MPTSSPSIRRLFLIANMGSGAPTHSLDDLRAILERHQLKFELAEVKTPDDTQAVLAKLRRPAYADVEAVAVFGGDGTVIAVLKGALELGLPVLTLPGGTANVVARHVGMPRDVETAIASYAQASYALYPLPLAEVGSKLGAFVLHLHFGLTSHAISGTSSRVKRLIGELAYIVSIAKLAPRTARHRYRLEIDGKLVTSSGYSLTVVNAGNIAVFGSVIAPRYRPGMVQLYLTRSKNPLWLVTWFIWRAITGRSLKRVVWITSARRLTILEAPRDINIDDIQIKASLPLDIAAASHTVNLIVPVRRHSGLARLWNYLKVNGYRQLDHLRRVTAGQPFEKFSRVDGNLYLGGQYRRKALKRFKQRGITGIISMRTKVPKPIRDDTGIEVLHLPTVDWTPPAIDDLLRGVAFINQHVSQGGVVYVHCRLGEGRGPTMAAAYLISRGLSADDAIRQLQRFRPFARPNRQQQARLRELETQLRQVETIKR